MVWRTVVLSAVNVVTVLMVFVPIMRTVTPYSDEASYIHNSLYLFLIQVATGIFAVVIDMLNKKPHLQSKLLAAGVALSATLAGIILWLVFTAGNQDCFTGDPQVQIGAWIPLLNVLLFGMVWYDQRKRTAIK